MAAPNIIDWTREYFLSNRAACKLIIQAANSWRELPSLNASPLHDIKDGQLVRFRGMIQDMYNPELYFQEYEVNNPITGERTMRSAMYRDTALCQEHETISLESKSNVTAERQTFVVMSVPGLNDWAREKSPAGKSTADAALTPAKRALDDDPGAMDTVQPVPKREKSSHGPGPLGQVPVSKDHLLNFPIPRRDGKACIVKVYEDGATFKLNQVVDVVGFASLDPLASAVGDGSGDMMEEAELQTHNPPASLVPRLHAIRITESSPIPPAASANTSGVRSDLHMILSQVLLGDDLAADFIIAHLLSSIYVRKSDLCLGNFPINISNVPAQKIQDFTKNFYNILAEIVPKSHYFDCTLENLNNSSLIPKKDYDCNRLTSGMLQLSASTHLVIDETSLTAGKLSPEGRRNYQAISDLLMFQKVSYDFKFYTMDHEADIPVLIFSEAKSFLPCPVQVPLRIHPETENLYPQVLEAVEKLLKNEERLNDIRRYLEFLRSAEFEIGDDITNTIQQDFVELRSSHASVNADNLHSLLVLARLTAISYGEKSLSIERWKESLGMEVERLERMKKRAG